MVVRAIYTGPSLARLLPGVRCGDMIASPTATARLAVYADLKELSVSHLLTLTWKGLYRAFGK